MRPFFIVLLIYFQHLFTSPQKTRSCISANSRSSTQCSYCYPDFYRNSKSNIYNEVFPLEECLIRNTSIITTVLFVNSKTKCTVTSLCDGSQQSPFDDMLTALRSIENQARGYKYSEFKLYVLEEDGNLVLKPEPQAKNYINTIFRRVNVSLLISPLFCLENNIVGCFSKGSMAKISLKTANLHFFISGTLSIKNVSVSASDVNLDLTNSCYATSSDCCSSADFSSNTSICYLPLDSSLTSTRKLGLFHLENIEDPTSTVTPNLFIEGVELRNFYRMINAGFEALITHTEKKASNINVKSMSIDHSFLPLGLVYLTNIDYNTYYLIDDLSSQRIADATYYQSVLKFSNLSLKNSNYFEFKAGSSMKWISLIDYYANMNISILNLSGKNVFGGALLNIDNVLRNSIISVNQIESVGVKSSVFIYISIVFQAFISDMRFYGNTLTTAILLSKGNFSITNITLDGPTVPTGNVIEFKESNITISDFMTRNAKSSSSPYYLIRCSTIVTTAVEVQMKSPTYQDVVYAFDRVFINNCSVYLSNVYLFTNDYSIITLVMTGGDYVSINNTASSPFINALTEQYGNFIGLRAVNFNSIQKAIRLAYTRNFTLENCSFINSTMNCLYDVFMISMMIENLPHNMAWIRNCLFRNVSIFNNGGNFNFFFTTSYTLFHGQYVLYVANTTFENIVNPFKREDYIFQGNSAHIYILNCTFIDLANMSVLIFPSRVRDGNLTISGSVFKFYKYPWVQIVQVNIFYNVFNLILENSFVDCPAPMVGIYALQMGDVDNLYMSNFTIKNINCPSGGALWVDLNNINQTLIKDCYFFKGVGNNENGADISFNFKYKVGLDFMELMKLGESSPQNIPMIGVINCTFHSSSGNGAITIDTGELLIINSSFINTSSALSGGAISIQLSTDVFVCNSKFWSTYSSQNGGGLYFKTSFIYIVNTNFKNNEANLLGGAISGEKSSRLIIKNSQFDLGKAAKGGEIALEKGDSNIKNCSFTNTQASSQGGGLYFLRSILTLYNVNISNASAIKAQALFARLTNIEIINTAFSNCDSKEGSGAVFLFGNQKETNYLKNFSCRFSGGVIGACLYAVDVLLEVNDCNFTDNIAYQESIIVAYSASFEIYLRLTSCIFKNNSGNSNVIKISTGFLSINNCFLNDNSFKVSLIDLQAIKANIYFSQFQMSPSNVKFDATFIKIKDSSFILIEFSFFKGQQNVAGLSADSVDKVSVISCDFKSGYRSTGAGMMIINAVLSVVNCAFDSNEAKNDGGAIYVKNSKATISSCNFTNNKASIGKGSDVFITSSLNTVDNSISGNITKSSFLNTSSVSISAEHVYFDIEEAVLIASALVPESQAIDFYHCIEVIIRKCSFKGMKALGVLNFRNDEIAESIISIYQTNFEDCNTIQSGGAMRFEGFSNIDIANCSVTNCSASVHGGGIYFLSKNLNSKLRIRLSSFKQNTAKDIGGAIYSEETVVSNDQNSNTFEGNSAKLGDDIFTFANKIVIIPDLADQARLDQIINDKLLFKNFLGNNSGKINYESKSGFPFNLGVIFVDHQNNVVSNRNDDIVQIDLANNHNNDNINISKSIAKLNKGIALLERISLVTSSNRTIHLIINTSSSTALYGEVNVNILKCGRGEIIDTQSCIVCQENFYSLEYDPEAIIGKGIAIECHKCPNFAKCPGRDAIIPENGYWRLNRNTSVVVKCLFSDACPEQNYTLNASISQQECSPGYYGHVCRLCEKNYVPSFQGCQACENNGSATVEIIFKLLIFIIMIILEIHYLMDHHKHRQAAIFRVFSFHNSLIVSLLKLEVGLNENARNFLSSVYNRILLTNEHLFNFHCLIEWKQDPNEIFETNIFLQIYSPITYVSIFFVAAFIDRLLLATHEKSNFLEALFKRIALIFIISFRFWLPMIIVTIMSSFRCMKLDETEEYMVLNPNLNCKSDEYTSLLMKTSIPAILLYIIILLYIYFRVRKSYRSVKSTTSTNVENKRHTLTSSEIIISEFKDRMYYWYVAEIVLLNLTVFFSQLTTSLKPIVQRMVLFVLMMTLYMIYSVVKPNHLQTINRFTCMSVLICILSMICEVAYSRIINTDTGNGDERSSRALSLIQILNMMFYLLLFVNLSPRISKSIWDYMRGIFKK